MLGRHSFCVVRGMLRPEVSAVGASFIDPASRSVFSFSCSVIGSPPKRPQFEEEIGPKLLAMVQKVAAILEQSSASGQRRAS